MDAAGEVRRAALRTHKDGSQRLHPGTVAFRALRCAVAGRRPAGASSRRSGLDAVGGGIPTPMKLSDASVRIAPPRLAVNMTRYTAIAWGAM